MGNIINNYIPVSSGIVDSVMNVTTNEINDLYKISLTNYLTTTISLIESGSFVPVGNSLYYFSTNNSISTTNVTSTASCIYYIEISPSSSEVTARYSTTIPAWDNSYNAYYSSNSRIIGQTLFTGTDYILKKLYYGQDIMKTKYVYGVSTGVSSTLGVLSLNVPMSDYIKELIDVKITYYGAILTSYTLYSTSVTLNLYIDSTLGFSYSRILVTGINY